MPPPQSPAGVPTGRCMCLRDAKTLIIITAYIQDYARQVCTDSLQLLQTHKHRCTVISIIFTGRSLCWHRTLLTAGTRAVDNILRPTLESATILIPKINTLGVPRPYKCLPDIKYFKYYLSRRKLAARINHTRSKMR